MRALWFLYKRFSLFGSSKKTGVSKWRLVGVRCQRDLWPFQEAKHLNRVCEQCTASYLVATWANWLLELRQ